MNTSTLKKLTGGLMVAALCLPMAGGAAAVYGEGKGPPTPASAGTANPGGTVYVANEGSGTISVIDAATNAVSATICLGSDPSINGTPQPAGPCNADSHHHNPLFNGHVGTHGLWPSPDGSLLLVANRISGTIVAVDTATNTVLGYAPVGREPHLATVRPGGREAWVAVRGESHIEVLRLDRDALNDSSRRRDNRLERVTAIDTVGGPSMVSFTSDGRYAFVAAAKMALVHKIDANSRKVVASAGVPAAFSPFGLVTPDDAELYLIHKGSGLLSILSTDDLRPLTDPIPVGKCPNHVAFVGNLAYVTTGGAPPCAPGGVDREGAIVVIDRTSRQIVHRLTGSAWTGDPHGIWPSPDGTRLYVGHERGSRITVVDTAEPNNPKDDRVVTAISEPTFLRQPVDVVVHPGDPERPGGRPEGGRGAGPGGTQKR